MSDKFPKLYIIHGWTYTIEPWQKTLASLKRQGIDVEILQVPGLTSPSKKIWSIDDYVAWAKEKLPANAIVLGHSNGGRILLNLALKYPKKIGHLILLNSAGVYQYSIKRQILKIFSKIFAPLKHLPLFRKIFHKLIGASDYSRAPENMKATLSLMLNSDRHLALSKIGTKTTILWGKNDKITPISHGQILNQKLKNSSIKVFPWSHAPYITHPEALSAAIHQVYLTACSELGYLVEKP